MPVPLVVKSSVIVCVELQHVEGRGVFVGCWPNEVTNAAPFVTSPLMMAGIVLAMAPVVMVVAVMNGQLGVLLIFLFFNCCLVMFLMMAEV